VKTLQELINRDDPGWPLVQQWVAEATNSVEILPPPENAIREEALVNAQVTTRSPMGAIIYESGGLLVDHGWLRILGSGHPRLPRSLPDWNFERSFSVSGQQPSFLLVADDVVGGFFAIDGGGLGFERGKVCYFAPDTMGWKNTGKGYSDFLSWSFCGDLAKYYESMRWSKWRENLRSIGGAQGFSIYPFLISKELPIDERVRKVISISELYDFHVGNLKS